MKKKHLIILIIAIIILLPKTIKAKEVVSLYRTLNNSNTAFYLENTTKSITITHPVLANFTYHKIQVNSGQIANTENYKPITVRASFSGYGYNTYDYVIFRGYSISSMFQTASYSNNGIHSICESISSSVFYKMNEDPTNPTDAFTVISWAFKCPVSSAMTGDHFELYLQGETVMGYNTPTYAPGVYILSDTLWMDKADEDSVVNAIESQTSAIEDTTQAIDDLKDADYTGQTEQADTTDYDDYQDAESDLMDFVDQVDLNNVNVAIDTDSSSWIWTTMTSIIQSNQLLFSMFISILSIGIIKLILGR